MRYGLTISRAVTVMMATLGVAATSNARSEPAVNVCVSVTPDFVPIYVREPRIIHVPQRGEATERGSLGAANTQAVIIHRHVSRVSSRHLRHGPKTPLPRQKPAILTPERAGLGASTPSQSAPLVPSEVGKAAQPEKVQSPGPADITATVPPAAARPAEVQPAAAGASPSPAMSEPAPPTTVRPAPDATASSADVKAPAVDAKSPVADTKSSTPDEKPQAPKPPATEAQDPKLQESQAQ